MPADRIRADGAVDAPARVSLAMRLSSAARETMRSVGLRERAEGTMYRLLALLAVVTIRPQVVRIPAHSSTRSSVASPVTNR